MLMTARSIVDLPYIGGFPATAPAHGSNACDGTLKSATLEVEVGAMVSAHAPNNTAELRHAAA